MDGIEIPPSDWNSARSSVQRLAALELLTVAPGHGRPISGSSVASEPRELAARFGEVAVPDSPSKSAGKSN